MSKQSARIELTEQTVRVYNHKPIGMGTSLHWCEKADLTYSQDMVKDGRCPYCKQKQVV